MAEWSAEAHVDEPLAARLIADQFAPLPERSVRLLSEGWDYAVFAVDETWAFRFPRREVVLPGMERELAVLPLLEPILPLPVPAPRFTGRPSAEFPWPFFGAALLPGVEAGEAGLGDEERVALVRPLARALRMLHGPGPLAAAGALLPFDVQGRADMTDRVPRTRDQLALLAGLGLWRAPGSVAELLDRAEALPHPEPTAVCHGDLHFRQLLVDGDRPSGLIDWVDVCRSDPGIDLQLAWSFFPPRGRAAFLDEYGPVGEASELRARVLGLFLNAILARYGHETGAPRILAEALAGLGRASS